MKIVLDTNIFISGIFWEGNYCSQIIDSWRNGKVVLISSPEIVQELVVTLRDFKIKMSEEMINQWRDMIIENSKMVIPEFKLDIVKDDLSDNKFFEAAVVGEADYIVSQDKHLLKVKEYGEVKVINPEDFVKLFD